MAHLESRGLLPVFERPDGLEPMVAQHLPHAVACALGPASDDGLVPGPCFGLDAGNHRLEEIGIGGLPFGGKVWREPPCAIDDRQTLVGGHEG